MSASAPGIADLLASLSGGVAGGAPPGMAPEAQGEPSSEDSIPDLLQQAVDLIQQAFGLETDPMDKQDIAKALMAVQAILANEQKERDQAMGGGNMRILRRNR